MKHIISCVEAKISQYTTELKSKVAEKFANVKQNKKGVKTLAKSVMVAAALTMTLLIGSTAVINADVVKSSPSSSISMAINKVVPIGTITVSNSGSGTDGVKDLFMKQLVPTLQMLLALMFVVIVMILGGKMGASAVSGDGRGRTDSIFGFLAWLAGLFIVVQGPMITQMVLNAASK